jgi:hypothetical protein
LLPLTALAIFPGVWLYGAYIYPFNDDYTFLNRTAVNATSPNGVNVTLPVACLCQLYSVCGCDDNEDITFIQELVGDGNVARFNKTLLAIGDYANERTLLLNGTLPNGTTAAGGTESSGHMVPPISSQFGWWLLVFSVLAMPYALQ